MIKGFDYYKEKFSIQTKEEINLGLGRIQEFLNGIANPQDDLKSIHIAGTNGKGSTLQFLRHILMEAGYSVGTFTSPHILAVNDQLSTNNGPISVEELEKTFDYLISIVDKKEIEVLTDFELLTVLAIVYFSRINKQDIVIFETGMGGLNDSTNVIKPLITIITNISLDHMSFLGNSIADIALQKAGIIKDQVACVTGVKNCEALRVIRDYANKLRSPLYALEQDFFIMNSGNRFSVKSNQHIYKDLEIGMKGQHQKENGALAIMAAEQLNQLNALRIEQIHIEKGIKKAFWPGRFELVSKIPDIILDGAHNPDAIEQLIETLKSEYPGKKFHFIFGAVRDKNASAMIRMLENIAIKMTFVDFSFPRAASAKQLEELSSLENKSSCENLSECLIAEIGNLKRNDILVIAGSLYLLSEVKEQLSEILNYK